MPSGEICFESSGCSTNTMTSHHQVEWDPVPQYLNIASGIYLFLIGSGGTIVCSVVLIAHKRLSDKLVDPSGLMVLNFILANLGVCILQFPFSGISSFFGEWVFGDFGCQAYSAIGFVFGIEVILGLTLIILDLYLTTESKSFREFNARERGNRYFLLICCSWIASYSFATPPLLGFLSRFHIEPCRTMCTIDYWHGNFNNYNLYMVWLVVCAFLIPIGVMIFSLQKSSSFLKRNKEDILTLSSSHYHHLMGTIKFGGLCLITQLVCWGPFAVLCLWTIFFPPETLNLYFTMSAPLAAKLSPILNGLLLTIFIPRIGCAVDLVLSRRTYEEISQEEMASNINMSQLRSVKRK